MIGGGGIAAVDRLVALLPEGTARLMEQHRRELTEIRLRAGAPIRLACRGGELTAGDVLDAAGLQAILAALMDYSVYARQGDLDDGFFTLEDGSRVGVCGRVYLENGRPRMGEIGSACLRVARAVPGCADGLMPYIMEEGRPLSALLASPPGLGKTTLLRDIACQLSDLGMNVGVADERHELAACHLGVPTLDVGRRSDVVDGCPRDEAIRRLLRGMAPGAIIADEIGGEKDARALADAARCGVAVIASAHGGDMEALRSRPWLAPILEGGAFRVVAFLGPGRGQIDQVWRRNMEGEGLPWRRA